MKGASRTQVRDALLMLQKEGLVERKIGSGTYLSERAPQIIELADASVHMSPERSHGFHETLEARLLIEPSVAARAAGSPTRRSSSALSSTPRWRGFCQRPPGSSSRRKSTASRGSTMSEAGNDFLCWTFDQIVAARRANKFDGGTDQAPVANLVRKHFHDRLSKIAYAITSRDPERARAEVESFLVGMAASSAL